MVEAKCRVLLWSIQKWEERGFCFGASSLSSHFGASSLLPLPPGFLSPPSPSLLHSLTHSLTHTNTRTLSHTHSHTHTHTQSLARTHSRTHARAHTHPHMHACAHVGRAHEAAHTTLWPPASAKTPFFARCSGGGGGGPRRLGPEGWCSSHSWPGRASRLCRWIWTCTTPCSSAQPESHTQRPQT